MVTVMVLTWYRNFIKKWWVESRLYSALNLPLPLRHECTGGGNQHRYVDVKIGKVETKNQDKLQKTLQSSMMVLEDTEYFSTKFWYLKKNLVRDLLRRISS